jgi:O-antigen/teichoic acid export membrane protein
VSLDSGIHDGPAPSHTDATIRRRIFSGTLSNYIGRFVGLGAWLILTPFLVRHLGPTEYGLFVVVGSLAAYGWLLNAGIQATITRYVAGSLARGELDLASRVLATSLWCDAILGLIAVGLAVIVAPFAPVLFQVPFEERAVTTWLVVLMGIGIGVTIPCQTGGAALRGLHRWELANLVDTAATLLNVAGVVLILLTGGGLIELGVVGIPVIVLSQLVSMWLVKRVAPGLSFGWRGFDPRLVRAILGFSWPLILSQTATLLQRKSDEIVIAALLPVSLVTPYALAHRLSDLCRELTKQFMGPFLPLASELDAQHDTTRLRELYVGGSRLALAIYLPLGCVLTILAGPILRVWVGAEYADNGALVTILTVAGAMLSTEWLATAVLQGMARHRLQGIVAMCSAIANVLLSVALVGPLGLTGVALGTLIPTTAEFAVVMPYAARVIGVTLGDSLRRIVAPAVIPTIATAGSLFAIQRIAEPQTLLPLVATAAIGIGVFAVTYFVTGASRAERALCIGLATGTVHLAQAYVRRP